MKNIIAIFLLSSLSSASFASVACFNSNQIGKKPLVVSTAKDKVQVAYAGFTCDMAQIAYKPNAAKYKGWLRFAPVGNSQACDYISEAIFGTSPITHETIDIYWLSMSPETLHGQKGFAQLGYQNDLDPGAGGTLKANLGCFTAR